MKNAGLTLMLILSSALSARPDTGTLIPSGKQGPDAAVLSLDEMRVEVAIDNGDAHVSIVQIFANHTAKIEEGTYRFALPTGSTVSDFAVWDGPVRIPAVILERKRAEQVYDQARLQAIDPGLLEAGERDSDSAATDATFTAKIVPIPPYGTKRLEIEYHQRLAVSDFKQYFALSLKPDAGMRQTAGRFSLHWALRSAHPMENFAAAPKLLPLTLTSNDAHTIEGTFEAMNFSLDDDFQATWNLSRAAGDKLEVITHRDPRAPLPSAGEKVGAAHAAGPEPGFFEAQLLVGDPAGSAAKSNVATGPSRTVVLLFDDSLSMQWEKLERSFAALEATLHVLKPDDSFNVLLFNQNVTAFQPQPVAATPAAVQRALEFVRASKLGGGTDLLKALTAAMEQATQPDTSIAMFTDGGSDRGQTVVPSKIAAAYRAVWKQAAHPPHTDVFAVGDDANLTFLRNLTRNGGFLESVLSTEPVDFHLQSWTSKLTHQPVGSLGLGVAPTAATSMIYSLDETVYPGSVAQWVGQYQPAGKSLTLTVSGNRNGAAFKAEAKTSLRPDDPGHPQLPRIWAQARVNALLEEIDRAGESESPIDEIIRLSRRYKFVTPYTSFLAVPRSLLRPRVIRPGDPVLRIRTDAEISSVIAMFPFGLTKPLRHLASEDLKAPGDAADRLWETRFLAPPEMKDGTYSVRLMLRDIHDNTYMETKTFVIASTSPTVKLQLARSSLHRGETLEIRASASSSTRTLTAHMEGINPVTLRWDAAAGINKGVLSIPADLPVGRYRLTVTAEDIAHNLGSQEVPVDVIP